MLNNKTLNYLNTKINEVYQLIYKYCYVQTIPLQIVYTKTWFGIE